MRPSWVFSDSVKYLSNKAMKVLFMIRRQFQTNNIHPNLMFKLFDSCFIPILLYGCEVWSP